ncbi:TPA: hypothetical protein RHZ01_001029 [Escherichia coli]|uniref:hypothetical protein n=1 Tax=Escherichia coli TaxID=562 RepID=UPI000BDE6934|nr:hypothetical protein [Escherichia coli]EFH4119695.1 hypothetical protein [Escherichia coli]NJU63188.1 hypothetical protein [Escherichia coli]QFF95521.1 hypothetical protein FTO72_14110 [Escherichia coli]HAJ1570083.1 hypothetical protein [Escherichia coli]HCP4716690.1 hypothetical protein [Escherichia coli]
MSRYELIKAICEGLNFKKTKKKSNQRSTSKSKRQRMIPKECIDKVPSDYQIFGESATHYLVA